VLEGVFAAACAGGPLDQAAIDRAGSAIVTRIESHGLANWIEIVRKHHSQTYQHCLLVTGVAVGFGRQLRLSNKDLKRLALAGMLHDIGKARVPIAILEKPTALDERENYILKEHVPFGEKALESTKGLPPEIVEAVAHHHEYLDGSGYPRGLQGREISDFVRVVTIADIFGALMERRAYKPPWSGEAAYQQLLAMGPKLDKDLVREFQAISRIKARA
jgi:putative nucleotidyltransferase with HDIG domain